MAQGSRVLETAAAQTGNRRTSRAERPQQHSRAQARRRNYAAQGRRRATRRPTQLLRLWVLASPQDLGPVPEPVPAGEPSSATTTEQRKNYVAHAVHTFHTHYLSLVSSERSVHNAPSPTVLTSRSHYKSGVKHWSQKLKPPSMDCTLCGPSLGFWKPSNYERKLCSCGLHKNTSWLQGLIQRTSKSKTKTSQLGEGAP